MDLGQNRTINGFTLYTVTECQGHLVGLADGGDSAAGCVVWVKPDGTMRMHQVRRDVQLPPRIAVNSLGSVRIAYSGWDSPDPEDMTWEPYRPYVAPVPVPAPITPPVIPEPAPEPPPEPPPVSELPEPAPWPEPDKPPPSGKRKPWWVKLLMGLLKRHK
jgi:hypothetical protein